LDASFHSASQRFLLQIMLALAFLLQHHRLCTLSPRSSF
jgi:hypothetical protein